MSRDPAYASSWTCKFSRFPSIIDGMPKYLEHPAQELLREEAKQLTVKIVKIRTEEGISFVSIARRLEISDKRCRRLYNKYRDRKAKPKKPKPGTSIDPAEVTINQRQYAKNLLDGQTKVQAAEGVVGKENATRFATETFQSPRFQEYFASILKGNGLTEEYISSVHAQLLGAKKTVVATFKGQITDTLEVPDNQARVNAVKIGWELYQRIGQRQQEQEQPGPGIVVITQQNKEALEQLFGHSLDPYLEMRPVTLQDVPGVKPLSLDPQILAASQAASATAPAADPPDVSEDGDSDKAGECRP